MSSKTKLPAKFRTNLHTHTLYSDGVSSPEDCVLKAIALGFHSLGFSDHAPVSVADQGNPRFSCAIEDDKLGDYIAEIKSLKIKYQNQIKIFLGIEEEYFPPMDKSLFDYTIGSVHYLESPQSGALLSIDYIPEDIELLIAAFDSVDTKRGAKLMVEQYYKDVVNVAIRHNPDILGHFDLIVKLNKNNRYFDTQSDWYKAVVFNALEEIAANSRSIIELNSGGINRGYLNEPYPERFILKQVCALSIPVTISSDAHNPAHLDFYFDEMIAALKKAGFKGIKQFDGESFIDVDIN